MTASRKVVKPEIVQQRVDTQNSNNVWNYVSTINSALKTNPIQADNLITVTFNWDLTEDMVDQIKEVYQDVGWSVDVGVAGQAVDVYPGQTILEFHP